MFGQILTTYLGLLFADAYMRSLWEGGGHGRGVTLFGWTEDKEEEEDKKGGETVEQRNTEVNHPYLTIRQHSFSACVLGLITMK